MQSDSDLADPPSQIDQTNIQSGTQPSISPITVGRSDEDEVPLSGFRAKIPCLFGGNPSRVDYLLIVLPALLFLYTRITGVTNMVATSGQYDTIILGDFMDSCCNTSSPYWSPNCCPSSVPNCCFCFNYSTFAIPPDWLSPGEVPAFQDTCNAWGEYYYGHPDNYSEYNRGGDLAAKTFCEPDHVLDPSACFQVYLNPRIMFSLNVASLIVGTLAWFIQEITYYYYYRKGIIDKVSTTFGILYTRFFCNKKKIHFYAALDPQPLFFIWLILLSIDYLSALAHIMTALETISMAVSKNAFIAFLVTMLFHFKRIIQYFAKCETCGCRDSEKKIVWAGIWLFCEGGMTIILIFVMASIYLGRTSGGY